MDKLSTAFLKVRKTHKTIELKNCFVAWSERIKKVVVVPKK